MYKLEAKELITNILHQNTLNSHAEVL